MTTRHAAALTLLGWYLMMPLMEKKGVEKKEVRISQWFIQKSFDSASACDTFLLKLTQDAQKKHELRYDIVHAECFASDDPRLAK